VQVLETEKQQFVEKEKQYEKEIAVFKVFDLKNCTINFMLNLIVYLDEKPYIDRGK
jgi:hypothetical protein